jgi:RNA polymerase sigma-70 factor, ECF subfamily
LVLSHSFYQPLLFTEIAQNCLSVFSFFFKSHETNQEERLSKEVEEPSGAFDEDHHLVIESQKGNNDAFEKLVKKHQARMMNIAFRMTGNYDDACETVQEAFLSAYRSINKFRGEARFSTWLYGICVNHGKNRINRNQRKSFHETVSLDDDSRNNDGLFVLEPADFRPTAEEALERRELQEKVQMFIDRLEPGQKEVLVLRDIEGFSYEEICDMLKLPEGTVKSRLFRARDAIKKSLNGSRGDY